MKIVIYILVLLTLSQVQCSLEDYFSNTWTETCQSSNNDTNKVYKMCCDDSCGVCGDSGCGSKNNLNDGSNEFAKERCCASGVQSLNRICGPGVGPPCMNSCLSLKLLVKKNLENLRHPNNLENIECSVDESGIMSYNISTERYSEIYGIAYGVCESIGLMCLYNPSKGRCEHTNNLNTTFTSYGRCEIKREFKEPEVLPENRIAYIVDPLDPHYINKRTIVKDSEGRIRYKYLINDLYQHLNPDKKLFFLDVIPESHKRTNYKSASKLIQEAICYSIGYEYGKGCGLPEDNPTPLTNGTVKFMHFSHLLPNTTDMRIFNYPQVPNYIKVDEPVYLYSNVHFDGNSVDIEYNYLSRRYKYFTSLYDSKDWRNDTLIINNQNNVTISNFMSIKPYRYKLDTSNSISYSYYDVYKSGISINNSNSVKIFNVKTERVNVNNSNVKITIDNDYNTGSFKSYIDMVVLENSIVNYTSNEFGNLYYNNTYNNKVKTIDIINDGYSGESGIHTNNPNLNCARECNLAGGVYVGGSKLSLSSKDLNSEGNYLNHDIYTEELKYGKNFRTHNTAHGFSRTTDNFLCVCKKNSSDDFIQEFIEESGLDTFLSDTWTGTCQNRDSSSLTSTNAVCCDNTCGQCGGSGCSSNDNLKDGSNIFGYYRCCSSGVRVLDRICGPEVGPPCVIPKNNKKSRKMLFV